MLRAIWITFALLGLVFSVVAGAGAWLATSLPWYWPPGPFGGGEIAAPGIEKPVTVRRDAKGVPHITAERPLDAYFALGYVHAEDRFWQMETMRRFGAGRLAEVLGGPALASDKWMRTLGLYRLAERQGKDLPAPVRAALEAYAAGVNQWIATDVGLPALEFSAIRYEPEPWKVADSLVWGKIMAARLGGNWVDEALRARMAQRIGPAKVSELWPAYPPDAPITIAGLPAREATEALAGLEGLAPWPAGAPRGASNVWALAPARTDSGGALLANDPHLGFQAPILWYLARIDTPALKLTGATVPGVPFHILGQNGRIAWGMTSTQSDITDLFIEKVSEDDPGAYVTAAGDVPFTTRAEVIKVKGGADVTLAVRATARGPVISDLRAGLGAITGAKYVVSLAATYLQPDDITAAAFHDLNRAGNWIDFNRALSRFQGPQQNFAYADTDGNIGFLTAGIVPIRGQGEGYVPSPGWTGTSDWAGFVPFAELPKLYKPADGLVVNANNRIVGEDYRHFLGYDWAPPYRARRIRQLLDDESSRTANGQVRILRDSRSLMADDLLPLMLDFEPETALAKRAVGMLGRWNRVMARSRPEPLIFMAWLRELNRALYGDELGELTDAFLRARPLLVKSILTRRRDWCDDTATPDTPETCADMLARSLTIALDGLSRAYGDDATAWRWGEAHQALFGNPVLGRVPGLGWLADLAIASDGGEATVNRGAMRLADDARPFAHVHGAGYRAVYDLADLDKSRYAIATGQSGNPLSAHYSDQLEAWRGGTLFPITRENDGRGSRFILRPAD